MSTFYGISSDSVSTLFSSLGGGNSATGNILSTYAQIRNGSYLKLAKAYYAKEETSKDKTNKNDKLSRLNAEQKAKELTEIKSNADNVIKSASELLKKDGSSVFKQVTTTGEDGKRTTGYDVEGIYKAVSKFVSDYNTAISSAEDSDTTAINTASKSMVNATKVNEKMLSQIGITIGSDNKLTMDEDTFKEADMAKVESLFSGNGSYGYGIKANASYMSISATNAASKNKTYTNTGSFTNDYNRISAFNGFV